MSNVEAVKRAAIHFGATVLGEGVHRLYQGNETGFGIKFKNWQYPTVIHKDGTIAFDNYNGAWGNISELDHFKDEYALTCAEMKCAELGWTTLRNGPELTVFHPEGGTIVIGSGGEIDATNFVGKSCEEATAKLEEALGKTVVQARKPEYNQTEINQSVTES